MRENKEPHDPKQNNLKGITMQILANIQIRYKADNE
jgi:hypothetical protein